MTTCLRGGGVCAQHGRVEFVLLDGRGSVGNGVLLLLRGLSLRLRLLGSILGGGLLLLLLLQLLTIMRLSLLAL